MRNQKGFTLPELLLCIVFFLAVGVVGAILYAAFHFLLKFW